MEKIEKSWVIHHGVEQFGGKWAYYPPHMYYNPISIDEALNEDPHNLYLIESTKSPNDVINFYEVVLLLKNIPFTPEQVFLDALATMKGGAWSLITEHGEVEVYSLEHFNTLRASIPETGYFLEHFFFAFNVFKMNFFETALFLNGFCVL